MQEAESGRMWIQDRFVLLSKIVSAMNGLEPRKLQQNQWTKTAL